jgi:predicted regulator of Ras-like GTPase activity (Roadblock/LC7/MglB family)
MAVRGKLEDMSLTGLISVNCNEGNQAHLHMQQGNHHAHIYFDGGEIAHLALDEREGESVIQEILSWEHGTFELEMNVPPPARTVEVPWHNLVLSGIQALDEGSDAQTEALEKEDWTTELDFEETEFTQPQEVDKMADLKELLREMAGEIPGFQAAAVSGIDGLSIAEYSASPDFKMEMATAQFALVMKLVQKTGDRLEAGEFEDNLVTTDDTYILSRALGDSSYYLIVSVEREMASLGNVRLMTRNFAPDLWDAIPRRN